MKKPEQPPQHTDCRHILRAGQVALDAFYESMRQQGWVPATQTYGTHAAHTTRNGWTRTKHGQAAGAKFEMRELFCWVGPSKVSDP